MPVIIGKGVIFNKGRSGTNVIGVFFYCISTSETVGLQIPDNLS